MVGLLFSLLVTVAATFSQVGRPSSEFLELEIAWNEAHKNGDAAALERLWSDELEVAVPRMAVMSKREALAFAQSGRMRFERYETSDIRVREYGDTAIVTGRLQRTRLMGGQRLDDDWRFTKVYAKRDGRWRVVTFHASETGKE